MIGSHRNQWPSQNIHFYPYSLKYLYSLSKFWFFRLFQDSQLRIISEIMGQVYNMGAVVDECDIMMEFKASGREGLVLPTEKCTLPQVEAISARYIK